MVPVMGKPRVREARAIDCLKAFTYTVSDTVPIEIFASSAQEINVSRIFAE
jgi:hypothetical protein